MKTQNTTPPYSEQKRIKVSVGVYTQSNTSYSLTSINVQIKILKNPVFESIIFFLDVY